MNVATLTVTLATGLFTNIFPRGLKSQACLSSIKEPKFLLLVPNGFMAAATVKILVERGFNVIGAVRTASKGEWLANKFGSAFTHTTVPDIVKPDAYDGAVRLGPEAILHMASPATSVDD